MVDQRFIGQELYVGCMIEDLILRGSLVGLLIAQWFTWIYALQDAKPLEVMQGKLEFLDCSST